MPQSSRWMPLPSPTNSRIIKAELRNKNLGFILTDDKKIFSYDHGNWILLPPLPGNLQLSGQFLVLANDSTLYAAAIDPTRPRQLLVRLNAGYWQKIETPNIDDFNDLVFISENEAWAGCNWGEILHFKDGIWRQVQSPSRRHIQQITYRHGMLYGITENRSLGEVLIYKDGKWSVYVSAISPESAKIAIRSDSEIWVLSNDGNVYQINNQSQKIRNQPDGNISDFAFLADGSGWFVTTDGRIYRYKNNIFKLDGSFTDEIDNHKITISPDGYGWIYGDKGQMWSYGVQRYNFPENSAKLTNAQIALGHMMGAAVIQISENRYALYLVDHENHNNLIPLAANANLKLSYAKDVAVNFGLLESQRSDTDVHNYDAACLAADFNNDGYEDILLTSLYSMNHFFINDQGAQFINATHWAGIPDTSGRWGIPATGDIDNDGDLDLFMPDLFARSRLFCNNGFGQFEDMTSKLAIDVPSGGKAGVFGDFNADGWLDLAITTEGEGVYLFKNSGNHIFKDISNLSPDLNLSPTDKNSAACFVDFDNDADLDLFICKKYVSNQLLLNDGTGRFSDVTAKVGLVDSGLTSGAIFFDADNDGFLDLFLNNNGPNAFYRNNNGQNFTLSNRIFLEQNNSWVQKENWLNLYGDISTGAVVIDLGNDGDQDILSLSLDARCLIIYNQSNNNHFLDFTLHGNSSNQSAIGARATLYFAGDRSKPLGSRIIESTSGYGSHSQKRLHFGVSPDSSYDVDITFAGGKTVQLQNLQPGMHRTIYEDGETSYRNQLFFRRIKNLAFGYRAPLRAAQILFSLIILFAMYLYLKRRFWWGFPATLSLVICWICALAFVNFNYVFKSNLSFVFAPLLTASIATSVWITLIYRLQIRVKRHANLEALAMKMAGFNHNAQAANLLTSLAFNLKNIPIEKSELLAFKTHFTPLCQQIHQHISPEIYSIVDYLAATGFESRLANELLTRWRTVGRNLNKIKKNIAAGKLPKALIQHSESELEFVQKILKKLRSRILAVERCDLVSVIQDTIALFRNESVIFEFIKFENLPEAQISRRLMSEVMIELFTNALRSMRNTQLKRIIVRTEIEDQITLEIEDFGSGIQPRNVERLFQNGYSTRPGGGHGLYLIKKNLKNYSGSISVKKTIPDHGTIMAIKLQKANPNEKTDSTY